MSKLLTFVEAVEVQWAMPITLLASLALCHFLLTLGFDLVF
jgi:hypothetical protein